jgi:hypothetical protein
MQKGASLAATAVLLCLTADVLPVHARPKVKSGVSGAMDICKVIDGGQTTVTADGTEVCCARETRGEEDPGHGTGPMYCVECYPAGSDNCTQWFGGRFIDPLFTHMLQSVRADQAGILLEQERIRTDLHGILAGLGNLQSRIDDVQAACAPADLVLVPVPVPAASANPPNFCRGDGKGNLIVRVKNRGSTPAPASRLRVTFSTLTGSVSVDTPAPPLGGGGGFIDLATLIPTDCQTLPGGGCEFHIAVDVDDAVLETDESNNTASGTCATPVP